MSYSNLETFILKTPMKLCSCSQELEWVQTWSNSARLQRVYIYHSFHESLEQMSNDIQGIREVFSREGGRWISSEWRNCTPRFGGTRRGLRTMKKVDQDAFDSENEVEDIDYDIGWD